MLYSKVYKGFGIPKNLIIAKKNNKTQNKTTTKLKKIKQEKKTTCFPKYLP